MAESHGDDSSKITVPKFSSFKTKKSLDSTTKAPSREHHRRNRDSDRDHPRHRHESEKSRTTTKESEDVSRRQERSKRKDRGSPSPRRSHHQHKRARSEAAERSPERERPHVSIPVENKGVDGLYIVDTKGDPLLRKYGNYVHYHVPSSYRYPPGRVLGAEGRLYIHRDGTREQFSIIRPGERPDLSRHQDGLRSRWPRAHPNPIRLKPLTKTVDDGDDDLAFIQVGKPRKVKHVRSSASDTSDNENGLAYRSIEGRMKAKTVPDTESDADSDVEADIHQDNPLRWRSVQLNLQVKEHPENIDAWLELVAHQDALLKAGHRIDQSLYEDEAHSYAEIKLSMLEGAISNAKSKEDRKRILSLLMREGAKVWDPKTAAKRWTELAEEERSGFDLWKINLDFRMSDVANFQYDDIKSLFLARLKHLLTEGVASDPKERFGEAVYVFLRMTRMIADAGYRELAFSAWQALFELNLYCPPWQDGSNPSLGSFQEFWESEVPRFGEAGAQGWRHYVETNGTQDPAETPVTTSAGGDEPISRDPYKLWAALEEKRGVQARTPARTLDEGNDEDPFRVVMFSDIEKMLFFIPPNILGQLEEQLIDAFLLSSGLPPAMQSSSWTQMASQDPHIVGNAGALRTRSSWGQPLPEENEGFKRPPLFKGRTLECALTLDLLFSGQDWFHYLPTREHDPMLPWEVVEQGLKQFVQLRDISGMAEYMLAVAYIRDPSNIKKQAKALLKQYPTNIALFIAYALAEHRNGKDEIAQKTLTSAAQISSGPDLSMVVRAWAWVELERRDRETSLRLLCSTVEPELRKGSGKQEPVSSSQIIKASKTFESEIHSSLTSGNSEAVALFGECALLLAYLTSNDSQEPTSAAQGGIEAAMEMTSRLSHELSRRSMQHSSGHEKLLQAAARILYWHAANGPFRRTFLYEKLSAFVESFPKNTIFLSLLEWSDSGLRVIDETRQLLHEKSLNPREDCLSTRIFAIQHEMERGNTNSTQGAFEDAVASDACKTSPLVWNWYIQFSYSQKSLRPKAKDIFYRALRHCPWSKEVMMQAFTTLARTMESHELKTVYETMTFKGMRIHVDMDDFLQQHETKRAKERGRR